MNIKVIALGKIKEKYMKSAIDEFLKRIRPYCSMQIVEVQEEPVYSDILASHAREIEAKKIREKNRVKFFCCCSRHRRCRVVI